jgi:hypothetical protein
MTHGCDLTTAANQDKPLRCSNGLVRVIRIILTFGGRRIGFTCLVEALAYGFSPITEILNEHPCNVHSCNAC